MHGTYITYPFYFVSGSCIYKCYVLLKILKNMTEKLDCTVTSYNRFYYVAV